jgi:NTE family protein
MPPFWGNRRGDREAGVKLGGVDLGPRPWLVLGGGGLRGLVHIGAWSVLSDAGFRPAGILGSSVGALLGACIASGRPPAELEAEARTVRKGDVAQLQRRALWVTGIRSEALFRREALEGLIGRLLPTEGWEGLQLRFQANAVELGSGRSEWFGAGGRTDVPLAQAIYASAALPLFFPPARLPGGAYVDGGVLDPLPLERARALGATGIVAVDASSGETADLEKVLEDGLLGLHQRVLSLATGSRRRTLIAEWSGPPLLYIRPALERFGTFDFTAIPYFLEEGVRATQGALAAAPRGP